MPTQLPQALEFELLADDWLQVKVDGHAFIYRVSPDRLGILRHKVKPGRRAQRTSEHYERIADDFALKEGRARGLIRATEPAVSRG